VSDTVLPTFSFVERAQKAFVFECPEASQVTQWITAIRTAMATAQGLFSLVIYLFAYLGFFGRSAT
jgi:hypothetical protein